MNSALLRCLALLAMVLSAVITACRQSPSPAPTPLALEEDYCWWAVLRSTRPPDSVAARFTNAFMGTGFSKVTFARAADTAWATAVPTELTTLDRATFAMRAVAYWHGDSTHFRYFVSLGPPSGAPAAWRDSVNTTRLGLDFCARIARAAAIGWSAPKEPTGDETLPIWSRIP